MANSQLNYELKKIFLTMGQRFLSFPCSFWPHSKCTLFKFVWERTILQSICSILAWGKKKKSILNMVIKDLYKNILNHSMSFPGYSRHLLLFIIRALNNLETWLWTESLYDRSCLQQLDNPPTLPLTPRFLFMCKSCVCRCW